ncbi:MULTISPECIES: sugar ABC transporter ATP-binding protein [Paenibacillus]|uniref:ATP-binding cassette domain-containing protein n=1 Tax=Paenibacillus validus TaxID=44253 RepID=A0A7X2ZAZ6_9BACL|nr:MULTISPECIES: sugar ABC transporter ATP-binding protein [Paenibacillus]MUG71522.1 ATP-binding cassette domain-containing protein [Paenibacillus validus]
MTLLQANNVHKRFHGAVALDGVHFELKAGEVHALLGANGAGKSTLIKIISGYHAPDSGEILINGTGIRTNDPAASHAAGIATIHQEHNLVPHMSVIDNVMLGRWPGRYGVVSDEACRKKVEEAVSRVVPGLDLDLLGHQLTPAEGQLIEIARALSEDARVLIMDEPTTSLSPREVDRLFQVMRELKNQGIGIIFVSHWLEEIFEICDRVTVFRDGRYVGTEQIKEINENILVRMMVNTDVPEVPPVKRMPGKEILTVNNLSKQGVLQNVSFSLREGEILTLAGLVGAGRTELVRCIFGIDPYDSGEVMINRKRIKRNSPAAAVKAGVGFVPEDRKGQGLVGLLTVRENFTLSLLDLVAPAGMIHKNHEIDISNEQSAALKVKAASIESNIMTLSGGNQQKVIIGRWLARKPSILILDEPTKGVDVGAKAEIHRLIGELAESGVAVLLVTSEMPEVLLLSDRVLVMREGKLTGHLKRSELSPERIIKYATTEEVTI